MVCILIGYSGSGKTTAATHLSRLGVQVIRLGSVTEEYLSSTPSEKEESQVRERLRKEFGPAVYAMRTLPSIQAAVQKDHAVVVEGVRSQEELSYFLAHLTDVHVVFITSDAHTRKERLLTRAVRPLSEEAFASRDVWEREGLHLGRLERHAEFVIANDGDKAALCKKIEDYWHACKKHI